LALHYRKRGEVWHCRGSVRVGRNTFPVREFSTGCASKTEAEAVGAAEEARIRAEFLDTGGVVDPVRVITIHDCIMAYRSRPGRLHPFDVQRLELGPQNSGKTALIGMLLKPIEEVSAECSLQDLLDNRQMDLPGYLAANLDELVFAERTEATALKNFMSGTSPARRPMRSNLSEKIDMRASLIGTSNKRLGDLIFDASGMRRFCEAMVKHRHEIEPFWQEIVDFDWEGLWQAVDENGDDPLVSQFADLLQQKQEEMRRPDNVELWASEWSPETESVVDFGKARSRTNRHVEWFGADLYQLFHAWEKKFDPGYRGTSLTRFGTALKSLIDFGRLCAWSHYKYGSKTVYRYALDNVIHMHSAASAD
jgi:hypothetical protein